MSPDADERLAFLADTVDLLWPGLDGTDGRAMTVIPNVRTPRLLVPIRPRRAAASAVRRYTAQQGPRERAVGIALASSIRAGLCDRLPRVTSTLGHGETIQDHLAEVLGQPVTAALALTHERPNRKPVLQVFDTSGRTLAFAKIGVSDLAARLVQAEGDALALLSASAVPHLVVPEARHRGEWHGMPVLVSSPLPRSRSPRTDDPVLVEAMHEVSRTVPDSIDAYLDSARDRAMLAGPTADPWLELFESVVHRRDLSRVEVGAWHGDWTEWNCARAGSRVLVWDWERFASPAPGGFDRLHFVLNHEVRARREHFGPAAAGLVNQAPELLRRWGLSAEDAVTVALLYVLDIALRYITDDLRSTDPGGRVEQWAFPIVRANLGAADAHRRQAAHPSMQPHPMSPEI